MEERRSAHAAHKSFEIEKTIKKREVEEGSQ